MEDKGCRVSQVAVAKVKVLGGVLRGRYDGDIAHFPLKTARELEARGEAKILSVAEPGMPNP